MECVCKKCRFDGACFFGILYMYSHRHVHVHTVLKRLLHCTFACTTLQVDRRYRRYCEQMRALAGGFEVVAGERAAAAYTALAWRTISRHFRSLRDGVVAQLKAARRALGEKDVAVPGMTRGDTPRLRVLDQCIRQQKALTQAGMMESHPWRPQRGLPERAVTILRAWLFEHFLHP